MTDEERQEMELEHLRKYGVDIAAANREYAQRERRLGLVGKNPLTEEECVALCGVVNGSNLFARTHGWRNLKGTSCAAESQSPTASENS